MPRQSEVGNYMHGQQLWIPRDTEAMRQVFDHVAHGLFTWANIVEKLWIVIVSDFVFNQNAHNVLGAISVFNIQVVRHPSLYRFPAACNKLGKSDSTIDEVHLLWFVFPQKAGINQLLEIWYFMKILLKMIFTNGPLGLAVQSGY